MRADMPKSGSVSEHFPAPGILKDANQNPIMGIDEEGNEVPLRAKPGGIVQGPRHVGLSRYAGLTADTPMGDADPDEIEAQVN